MSAREIIFAAAGSGLSGSISYTLGTAGAKGVDANSGSAGGNSTLSYLGVSLTANGGSGGNYNTGTTSSGGTASGGTSNATGGTGGGVSGDVGGAGGGGINVSDNGSWSNSAGQDGASAIDFQGLSSALSGSGYSLGTGGTGSAAGSAGTANANNGNPGTGIGAGGGGAGFYGGNGGNGSYGGGGGGAAGYTAANMEGGDGGQGVLVIQRNGTTTTVLISGTSYAIPGGTYSIKVWLIGAGGGGAGATNNDNTSGGGGAAGGIAYYSW